MAQAATIELPRDREQAANKPESNVLRELFATYAERHPQATFQQFKRKLLKGIVVCDDLEIEAHQKLAADKAEPHGADGAGDQTAVLQHLLDSLMSLTVRDGLTGLFNRRYFNHRLEQEIQRAARLGTPCSVMLIDVDDFKRINDSFGHGVGDQVLERLAAVLSGSLRATDEVTARFGGEEFALILPNTDLRAAFKVGKRLCCRVRRDGVPSDSAGEPIVSKISISGGVATFDPQEPQTINELLKAADTALYRAKAAGKDRVEAFGDVECADRGVSTDEREALFR